MKQPLKLSFAITLALGGADLYALGLGTIHVKSGLNQPLNAEIPVIASTPGETEGLLVQLATAEDFDRVGLNRSHVRVPLEFSVAKNAQGQAVIKITTKDIVSEPFLDFLIEANWPKGRLLREYTVLLDPPVMAPAKGSAVVAVAKEPEPAVTQPLPESQPESKPAAKPSSRGAPKAAVATEESKPKAAPHGVTGNEYGPVAAGETLSVVARATRTDESVSLNQMMLALLKNNPNAFYKDNINALKRGAILRIPSSDEIKAIGSASAAAAQVRAQVDEWRSGSKPVLVARTEQATAPKPAKASAAAGGDKAGTGEHVALVPPRMSKDNQSTSGHPGSGNKDVAGPEVKAELARTKEALSSREQEASDLKSRVTELEALKSKNDHLLSLKDSELAQLQQRLKDLQEQQAKAAKTPANATAPIVAPATTLTEQAKPADQKPVDQKTADQKAPDQKVSDQKPANDANGATAVSGDTAKPAVPGATAPAGTAPAPATTQQPSVGTPPVVTNPAPKPDENPAPKETASPASTSAPGSAKPAATTPVVTTPKNVAAAKTAPVTPAPTGSPWYTQTWVLAVAGLFVALLVGLGLRKRNQSAARGVAGRSSIADSFGALPLSAEELEVNAEEEAMLLEQIHEDPTDASLHLELLSLYYAESNAAKFEAAAEDMYAHIPDPSQPEWQQVVSMGEELAPHNSLFGGAQDLSSLAADETMHDASNSRQSDFATRAPYASDPSVRMQPSSVDEMHAGPPMMAPEPELDFDFTDEHDETPVMPPSAAVKQDNSHFEPRFFEASPQAEPAAKQPAPLKEPVPVADEDEDEFFSGEDAVGTKLDLAKAYLDMGDTEGARSMLDEVLSEGNSAQQSEARKLIAEIK